MRKGRILIASVLLFGLVVAATGAWAVTKSRIAAQTDSLLNQAGVVCQTADSPGCAELLNQIEPGA